MGWLVVLLILVVGLAGLGFGLWLGCLWRDWHDAQYGRALSITRAVMAEQAQVLAAAHQLNQRAFAARSVISTDLRRAQSGGGLDV